MRKLPILFRAPMIRALLDGRKTQTRRALKPQPEITPTGLAHVRGPGGGCFIGGHHSRPELVASALEDYTVRYRPGDLLWVRETYYQFGHWEPVPFATTKGGKQKWAFVPYGNVSFDVTIERGKFGPWRKSMHREHPETPAWHKRLGRFMPRSASRITLRVTGVKVERLRDISEADAIAEGLEQERSHLGISQNYCFGSIAYSKAKPAFAALWESINGPGSWDANPWVAAYSFKPIFENIDAVAQKESA